ncbi:hypothetical protein K491DRAFT_711200 [Lophiostoma macrostomum CBS 122681]|uniref:Uncharacterized protein n=1 Tax=Lophiostoma macrostomum CBS 122681 TaxID=1314788 RepID=A0A6A6TNA7_9PLEO|nr:hypothetical protein K491DRAFT_711200 [Lophiostoma macrostomum CBS 122681]
MRHRQFLALAIVCIITLIDAAPIGNDHEIAHRAAQNDDDPVPPHVGTVFRGSG